LHLNRGETNVTTCRR